MNKKHPIFALSSKFLVLAVCVLALCCCKNKDSFDWKTLNEQWMAANALRYADSAQFHVTESGLQYYIEYEGDTKASHPNSSSTVYVSYTGKLIDGHVFDSGSYTSFTVGNTVEGFAEGLRKMYPGGKAVLFIPAKLGYGEDGTGTRGYSGYIPPHSALIFEVSLAGKAN